MRNSLMTKHERLVEIERDLAQMEFNPGDEKVEQLRDLVAEIVTRVLYWMTD